VKRAPVALTAEAFRTLLVGVVGPDCPRRRCSSPRCSGGAASTTTELRPARSPAAPAGDQPCSRPVTAWQATFSRRAKNRDQHFLTISFLTISFLTISFLTISFLTISVGFPTAQPRAYQQSRSFGGTPIDLPRTAQLRGCGTQSLSRR
jgi:hypothetical protein